MNELKPNQILIFSYSEKPILNKQQKLDKRITEIIQVLNLIMGNRQRMISKNFYVPNTLLDQNITQTMKIICSTIGNNLLSNLNSKHIYKTYSLKTRKQVEVGKQEKAYNISSLKIMTYNIWFQQHNVENRTRTIIDLIRASDADVICLQQVTSQFMKTLWDNASYVCEKHELFLPLIPMHWYDTIILSKFPIQFYQIPFESTTMSRNLLTGVFQLNTVQKKKITFSINCVHLQSLNNKELRIKQLKQISQVNKNMDIVSLVGDLNFDDNWPQDKIIQAEYIDVWNYCKDSKQERWTMPQTTRYGCWRPDHVLLRNNSIGNNQFVKNHKLQAKIERLGMFTVPPFQAQKVEYIAKDDIVRTPSDHMGLIANIRF